MTDRDASARARGEALAMFDAIDPFRADHGFFAAGAWARIHATPRWNDDGATVDVLIEIESRGCRHAWPAEQRDGFRAALAAKANGDDERVAGAAKASLAELDIPYVTPAAFDDITAAVFVSGQSCHDAPRIARFTAGRATLAGVPPDSYVLPPIRLEAGAGWDAAVRAALRPRPAGQFAEGPTGRVAVAACGTRAAGAAPETVLVPALSGDRPTVALALDAVRKLGTGVPAPCRDALIDRLDELTQDEHPVYGLLAAAAAEAVDPGDNCPVLTFGEDTDRTIDLRRLNEGRKAARKRRTPRKDFPDEPRANS